MRRGSAFSFPASFSMTHSTPPVPARHLMYMCASVCHMYLQRSAGCNATGVTRQGGGRRTRRASRGWRRRVQS